MKKRSPKALPPSRAERHAGGAQHRLFQGGGVLCLEISLLSTVTSWACSTAARENFARGLQWSPCRASRVRIGVAVGTQAAALGTVPATCAGCERARGAADRGAGAELIREALAQQDAGARRGIGTVTGGRLDCWAFGARERRHREQTSDRGNRLAGIIFHTAWLTD